MPSLMIWATLVWGLLTAPFPLEEARSKDFLRKGDRLAREKKYSQALEAWRDGYLFKLPEYRGLPFLHRVAAQIMPRRDLKQRMLDEFVKEYPDAEIEADTEAYAQLGFFSSGFDLKSVLLGLLTEEIAGFYDPDTKQLYLIQEDGSKKESWFSKLLGGSSFDPSEQKTILAHELSHALMDQYFDLYSLHRSLEADEDSSLALSGLIEGEATLSMLADMQGNRSPELLKTEPQVAGELMSMISSLARGVAGGDAYSKAPLVLQETLLFPYVKGLLYCWQGTALRKGSWEGVNAAFQDPPLSTEQILHPEKYWTAPQDRDMPQELILPPGGPFDPASWELVKENVLGELQTQILLRDKLPLQLSVAAAAGWDGDLYRVYRSKAEAARRVLVWVSEWDSNGDAAEFAEAAVKHFTARKRGGAGLRREGVRVTLVAGNGDSAFRDTVLDWATGFSARPKKMTRKSFKPSTLYPDSGKSF